jgi:hypothetical protein
MMRSIYFSIDVPQPLASTEKGVSNESDADAGAELLASSSTDNDEKGRLQSKGVEKAKNGFVNPVDGQPPGKRRRVG